MSVSDGSVGGGGTVEDLLLRCCNSDTDALMRCLALQQLDTLCAWLHASDVCDAAWLRRLLQRPCTLTVAQRNAMASWSELLADKFCKLVASEYAYLTMPGAETGTLTIAVAHMRDSDRYNNNLTHQLYKTPAAAAAALHAAARHKASNGTTTATATTTATVTTTTPVALSRESIATATPIVSKRARRLHDSLLVVLLYYADVHTAARIVLHLLHRLHAVQPGHVTRARDVLRVLCGKPCADTPPAVCWDALTRILRGAPYKTQLTLRASASQLCRYTDGATTATATARDSDDDDDDNVDGESEDAMTHDNDEDGDAHAARDMCVVRLSQVWLYRDTLTRVHVVQRNDGEGGSNNSSSNDGDAAASTVTRTRFVVTPDELFARVLDVATAQLYRAVPHNVRANGDVLQRVLQQHQSHATSNNSNNSRDVTDTAAADSTAATADTPTTTTTLDVQQAAPLLTPTTPFVATDDDSTSNNNNNNNNNNNGSSVRLAVAAVCTPKPTATTLSLRKQRQLRSAEVARATQLTRQLKDVLRLSDRAVTALTRAGVYDDVLRSNGWVPLTHVVACIEAWLRPSSLCDAAVAASSGQETPQHAQQTQAQHAQQTQQLSVTAPPVMRSVADLVELVLTQHNLCGRYELGVCDVPSSAFAGQRCARAAYAHVAHTSPPLWRRIVCTPARRVRTCRDDDNIDNDIDDTHRDSGTAAAATRSLPSRAWLYLDSYAHPRKWRGRVLLPCLAERPMFVLVPRAALTKYMRYRNAMLAAQQPCLDDKIGSGMQLLFVEVHTRALLRDTAHTRIYAGPQSARATTTAAAAAGSGVDNGDDDDDDDDAHALWYAFTNYDTTATTQTVKSRTVNKRTASFVLDDEDNEEEDNEAAASVDKSNKQSSNANAQTTASSFVAGGGLPLFYLTGRCAVLHNPDAQAPPTEASNDTLFGERDSDADSDNDSDSDSDADRDGNDSEQQRQQLWRLEMRYLSEHVLPRTLRWRRVCASLALPDNPFRNVLTSADAARLFACDVGDANDTSTTPLTSAAAATAATTTAAAGQERVATPPSLPLRLPTDATTTTTTTTTTTATTTTTTTADESAALFECATTSSPPLSSSSSSPHSPHTPPASTSADTLDVRALEAQVRAFADDTNRCVAWLEVPVVGSNGAMLRYRQGHIEALKDYIRVCGLQYQLCKTTTTTTTSKTKRNDNDSSGSSGGGVSVYDSDAATGMNDRLIATDASCAANDAATAATALSVPPPPPPPQVYELRKSFLWGDDEVRAAAVALALPAPLIDDTLLALLRRALTRECENALTNNETLEFTGDALIDFVVVLDACALKMLPAQCKGTDKTTTMTTTMTSADGDGDTTVTEQKASASLPHMSVSTTVLTTLCNNKVFALLLPPEVMAHYQRRYGTQLAYKVLADVFEAVVGAVYRSRHELAHVRDVLRRLFARLPSVYAAVVHAVDHDNNNNNTDKDGDGTCDNDSNSLRCRAIVATAHITHRTLREASRLLALAYSTCPYVYDTDAMTQTMWPLSSHGLFDDATRRRYHLCGAS